MGSGSIMKLLARWGLSIRPGRFRQPLAMEAIQTLKRLKDGPYARPIGSPGSFKGLEDAATLSGTALCVNSGRSVLTPFFVGLRLT